METVYRICSEDVLSCLSNRENGEEVLNQVRRSFSCMEELQVFVEVVENAINREKKDNFTPIEIKENQLDLVVNYPEGVNTLPTGATLLVLETANYLFHLLLEQYWGGKFLSYDIYRKDYYSCDKYTLDNFVSNDLESIIEQDSSYEYSLQYFMRLFGKFLANGEEQIILRKDDESSVVIERTILEEYLTDDDDVTMDYPKTVEDFQNKYIYDDVHELLEYLKRQGKKYFQFGN
ncbi:hypothetical protein [Enterococcus gilvus]|uniref:hypothetical protein n=1 Tax=Enterococcus gilvus TaxID=160453 RepID=UPI0028D212C3|nr:hypothetical protein [Enterococcus gilvus]